MKDTDLVRNKDHGISNNLSIILDKCGFPQSIRTVHQGDRTLLPQCPHVRPGYCALLEGKYEELGDSKTGNKHYNIK